MRLMRIGARGAERPVVRVDEQSYVDVSDLVDDFGEAFFAAGGAETLRDEVAARIAAGSIRAFAGERIGGIEGLAMAVIISAVVLIGLPQWRASRAAA